MSDATAAPHPSPTSPPDDPIVGIDLGTTNSLVAHCTAAGPVVLKSPEGHASLPSVVRLLAGGDQRPAEGQGSTPYRVDALGRSARDHALQHPASTLHSTKRLLGRSARDLADDLPHLAYRVVEGPHETARIQLPHVGETSTEGPHAVADQAILVTPQEVAALLLRELKRWAEAALGTAVRRAVITVPAYFDDAQRQATRDAGRLAGLDVLRLVNEPTAAALAYGLGLRPPHPPHANRPANTDPSAASKSPHPATVSLNTKINPAACSTPPDSATPPTDADTTEGPAAQQVAIYDLGGGTFDISILRLQPTAEGGTLDQVLATDGDTHLGGNDLDHQLVELFTAEIRQQFNIRPNSTDALDTADAADLDSGASGEPQSDPSPEAGPALPAALRQALRQAAERAKIQLSDADTAEVRVEIPPSPDHPAADRTYRRTLRRAEFDALIRPLIDRTLVACRRAMKNAGLSPADLDQVILVGGSTRVPLVRQRVADHFDREPYTALDPDQVVALGAAVQAAVLAGIHRDTLLLDVIPLSLGIETMGGAVAKLITANSTIPARATERFSTYVDGQANVKIHVLQGERELVQDCRSLATFDLTGIPPMPAGLPKILVTFLVDANGILSVQALEERSGRRARVQVLPHHGLTSQEVAQIEADSFTHARADMRAHRLIDLRLNAKLDLRNIQKQLDRFADDDPALSPDYRAQIQAHLQAVRGFVEAPDDQIDADAFQQALHDLDHATLRLAEINIARTLREDAAAT